MKDYRQQLRVLLRINLYFRTKSVEVKVIRGVEDPFLNTPDTGKLSKYQEKTREVTWALSWVWSGQSHWVVQDGRFQHKHTNKVITPKRRLWRGSSLSPFPLQLPSLCSLITCEMVFRWRETRHVQAARRHFRARRPGTRWVSISKKT